MRQYSGNLTLSKGVGGCAEKGGWGGAGEVGGREGWREGVGGIERERESRRAQESRRFSECKAGQRSRNGPHLRCWVSSLRRSYPSAGLRLVGFLSLRGMGTPAMLRDAPSGAMPRFCPKALASELRVALGSPTPSRRPWTGTMLQLQQCPFPAAPQAEVAGQPMRVS